MLIIVLNICLTMGIFWFVKLEHVSARQENVRVEGFAGSVSCRECHDKFYQLWSTSFHGLAMQSFTPEFARTKLVPQKDAIRIGNLLYRTKIQNGKGWVLETGPQGEKRYSIEHAMGGKNVYYFLTLLEKGRLQVLPVAFDVRKKKWFNTTASMIRHFTDRTDEALNWKERPLTFNTACYSCHVSQLSTNYDLKTDTYRTIWAEPGINCETCHGPGEEHNRVCREVPKGQIPKDLKIISTKKFTPEQHNSTCAPCHAKMVPLTTTFKPGDRYFDHFDLGTLEDRDFYPDGRDLGENYTYTLWRMSPCVKSGQLSCIHCHTSSGRYRFKAEERANQACMPCHKKNVENSSAHTHHKIDSPGNKCIACHMPMTEFARMRRSDHSILPPVPAATIAFKSPNACNICHTDFDAARADKKVREWRKRDYQAPLLHRASLIEAARKRDWSELPEMLKYLTSKEPDEIYATSLIRLLAFCNDNSKWPVFRRLLKEGQSPLVRSAAATALTTNLNRETINVLLAATTDDYRLVRIRAVASLSTYSVKLLGPKDKKRLEAASGELFTSLTIRPDDWASHYNMGNYLFERGEPDKALSSYNTASKLQPDSILPLVNISLVYSYLGQTDMAEKSLKQALKLDPTNAAANFNLGLLMAERGEVIQAEKYLRIALKTDPDFAEAAFNLSVLISRDRLKEAIELSRKASKLRPDQPRYAYTYAFYLNQSGNVKGASQELQQLIRRHPVYIDAHMLLGMIYEKQGKLNDARALYLKALENKGLSKSDQFRLNERLRDINSLK
jgi:tetratricopeptide (TPR) repeat protein